MREIDQYFFKNDVEWRNWLHENHNVINGVYLIFYKVNHENDSMRWEEAVQVALCYGWIDSKVKSLGEGKRQQYFCQRKPKSNWSKLNKSYIKKLNEKGLMHESGLAKINAAKMDGSWNAMDEVEEGIIPLDLQKAFEKNSKAFNNYQNYTFSQRKSYLFWLNQAKRKETRQKRIKEIIRLCAANRKQRTN